MAESENSLKGVSGSIGIRLQKCQKESSKNYSQIYAYVSLLSSTLMTIMTIILKYLKFLTSAIEAIIVHG